MLQQALRYQQMGLSVIPIRPKGKEPSIKWAEFQQRKATEEEIRKWWNAVPNANIGIVTGSISGIVVIDLDGLEGLESGRSLRLASLVTVITGKGRHLWYKHPGGIINNSVKKYPGIDVRGDGGYVLVPPSIHPNGQRYRMASVLNVARLPIFPKEIFAEIASQTKTFKEEGWIGKALEEMKDGNIDNTLFSICSRLRNDGWTSNDARILLEPHAARVGAEKGHLEEKIRNVWNRYEPKPIQRSGIRELGSERSIIIHSPISPISISEYNKRQQQLSSPMEYSTGYPKFDTLTKGLKRGEILTIAARTGVGKTNWVITPIRQFCEAGKKVLLFSTEMSFDQIWDRYKSTLSKSDNFKGHSFYVCDEFTPSPERIEEALRQVMPDLFIFDHINHVGTEHHELAKFMMSLKELARKFDIPGIVTAQLNRAADWVENGQKVIPRLSMIKGSGSIEEISAQVLLLWETRVHQDYTEIMGNVDKNRHGNKGILNFALQNNPYRMVEL